MIDRCFATFVLKSPLFERFVAQLGFISESLSIRPAPITLTMSPVAEVSYPRNPSSSRICVCERRLLWSPAKTMMILYPASADLQIIPE